MKIEIDDEVFSFLQEKAVPFVDTPNTVLRRLLLGDKPSKVEDDMTSIQPNVTFDLTQDFIRSIIQKEFDQKYSRKIKRYRMMFKVANNIVYFQNFNKSSDRLWFRITQNPLSELKKAVESAYICFTNPSDKIFYLIPFSDINERIGTRDYLEVNIDVTTSRWLELDWNIEDYKKQY